MNIIGEIVSGVNFDYDHLYVYYELDLPPSEYRADRERVDTSRANQT